MHNEEILRYCYHEISKEEDVYLVDFIPQNPYHTYVNCWRLTTFVSIKAVAEKIELYIGFSKAFPYEAPDIFYFDTKYDFFPHIDYSSRKLCYLEKGVTFDISNPVYLLQNFIHKVKRLIEKGAKRENMTAFQDELYSYWNSSFNGEPNVDNNWLLYGSIPTESQVLNVWSYKERLSTEKGRTLHIIIPMDRINQDFEQYIRCKSGFEESKLLFLANVDVPSAPPYSIIPNDISNWITEEKDLKLFKKNLNKERQLLISFPLRRTNYLGGIRIPLQPVCRNGFRGLSAYQELTQFEKRNKCLQRFTVKIYSSGRIAQRTAGKIIENRSFAVVGLGSIGSNLCYFLNGWTNAEFLLVDDDFMQPENIGRHLHGMKYIQQSKVHSVAEFLREKRPDMNIKCFADSIENVLENNLNEFNRCSAVFLNMADGMSEQYVLSLVKKKELVTPIMILWLEPFAVAGHLIYINPTKNPNIDNLLERGTMLYKYNLILSSEYIKKSSTEFVRRDAGCNGSYALYSGNDVILFLSAIYPIIDQLLNIPTNSVCYRWVGNINIAKEKNIALIDGKHQKGSVVELPL